MAKNNVSIAKLYIEGDDDKSFYTVLRVSYHFEQGIGSTHLPNSDVKAGVINLTLESRKEDVLIEWMTHPTMRKKVTLVFEDGSVQGSIMKVINLDDALCFSYNEVFDHKNEEPMVVHLGLAVGKLTMNGSWAVAQPWYKEPEKTEVTTLKYDDYGDKGVITTSSGVTSEGITAGVEGAKKAVEMGKAIASNNPIEAVKAAGNAAVTAAQQAVPPGVAAAASTAVGAAEEVGDLAINLTTNKDGARTEVTQVNFS